MSYAFSDQLNKLASLLGDPNTTSDDMFPLTQRQKEINRGELQFAIDAKDLKEYATSTISGMQIALPSDWFAMYCLIIVTTTSQVVITNDREISIRDWERYYLYASDRPFYYIWDYSGIKYIKLLGATSNNGRTYNLYYYKKPTTELSALTDVSLHREEFREASCFFAAAQLMQQIGKYTQAEQFMNEYQGYVQRARDLVGREVIDVERANPDFGVNISVATDIQGRGYIG